jgi:hypothetical protein
MKKPDSPAKPPSRNRFKLPLRRSFSFGGIRSRGIDNLPPAVSPDPEPPALPVPNPNE